MPLREVLFFFVLSLAVYLGSVFGYHSLVGLDWIFGNGWTVAAFLMTSPLVSMPYTLVFLLVIAIPLFAVGSLIALFQLFCIKMASKLRTP